MSASVQGNGDGEKYSPTLTGLTLSSCPLTWSRAVMLPSEFACAPYLLTLPGDISDLIKPPTALLHPHSQPWPSRFLRTMAVSTLSTVLLCLRHPGRLSHRWLFSSAELLSPCAYSQFSLPPFKKLFPCGPGVSEEKCDKPQSRIRPAFFFTLFFSLPRGPSGNSFTVCCASDWKLSCSQGLLGKASL